jgi:alanine racemase
MHRQGILIHEIDEALNILSQHTSNERMIHPIVLDGICSHLSDADNVDESATESQIALWNKAVDQCKNIFPSISYIHLAATDGHIFGTDIHDTVSRLGIGLYGITSNKSLNNKLNLRPVLSMKTIITGIKKLAEKEHVGYGNSFVAPHDMKIATIPVGYYEGVDRRFSNKGYVLVGEKRIQCPIIGRVSMNITSIDVSNVPEVTIGDEVLVISDVTKDINSIRGISEMCETIPYEIAVHVPAHLKRNIY